MGDTVRQGCLVLADIGNYTAYLTSVELAHSHDILADLVGVVAGLLCPPLRLEKLEGDAVFCAARAEQALDSAELLDAIEATYLAFARRRRTISLSSSCTCDACRKTPELELKFCAHHGSFVEHDVAGSRELVGGDVIVAHRLLKNSVVETHDTRGYALLTDACADALGISGLRAHIERYDDVGEISCRVLDLEAVWRAEQDAARTLVSREDALVLLEADLAAGQEQVWDAITDPTHGMRWRVNVDDMQERNTSGERGVGTVTHCVHGRTTIEQEIIDWLPPHHYTFRERNPAGKCLWTMSLAPIEANAGTHIEWRFALDDGRLQAARWRLVRHRATKILRANFDSLLEYVQAGARGREEAL